MSRRRYRAAKASSVALKALPTDVEIMAGTLADASARQIGNNEIYWRIYKTHPWVRACIGIIANAVAQEGYDVVPVDDGDKLDEEDPRIQDIHAFFRIAWVGRFNTFRKAVKVLATDQQTYGVAYVRKKYGQVDGQKALVGLERLDARYVVPHLTQDRTEIDYFVLTPTKLEPADAIQQAAQQIAMISGQQGQRIDAAEIIMLSTDEGGDAVLPSPSPLESLDLTVAMDMNVRKHRNSFFENGATLGNVLTCLTATPDQLLDAQKKLTLHHNGSRRAYKNVAIAGDWKLLNLMQGGRHEVDFVKGTQIVINEICAVFKVPPSKLQDVSGSMGQAGKGEDDETFEQECVLPIEECLYETLTLEVLHKEFGIDDLRMVPARRNNIRLDRFDAAIKLVKFGGSGNQALDLVGLPTVDDEKMNIPLFLGATAGNVAQDEPAGPAPAEGDGNVTTPTEANTAGNENEVGAHAQKGFHRKRSWY